MSHSPQRPIQRPPQRPVPQNGAKPQRVPPRFHPAVPAAIVMKHVQASRNRVGRCESDAENVRRGLRALEQDAMTLRAALQSRPEDLAILERGLMTLLFVGNDLIASHETTIRVEQAFQNECALWLQRKEPLVRVEEESAPRPIEHVPSIAHEVPTPASIAAGDEARGEVIPTDKTRPAGFYEMADGTHVYTNADNEPLFYSVPRVRDGQKVRVFVDTENNEIAPPAGLPGPWAPPPKEPEPQSSKPSLEAPPEGGS